MVWNFKAMRWCWENGIKVYPHPMTKDGGVLKIIISDNGNEKLGEKKYNKETVYSKINEIYSTLYNRNNGIKK